jgi:hypothetical protein
LNPGGRGQAGGGGGHLFLGEAFHLAHRVVDGGGHQVFQHVLVVRQQGRVDGNALDVVLAAHDHLDQAGAGFALHFHLRDLGLELLHVCPASAGPVSSDCRFHL